MEKNNEIALLKVNEIQNLFTNDELKKIFVEQIDFNEANKKGKFDGFNDLALIAHYLTFDKHVLVTRSRSKNTITVYSKVIMSFYNALVLYSDEINMDIEHPVHLDNGEASLLRSLEPRHIRRYVEWFQKSSPYVKGKQKEYKLSSLAQKLTIIKSFLKQLYEWNVLSVPLHLEVKSTNLTSEDRPNRDAGTAHVLFLLKLFEKEKNLTMFAIIHFLTTTGIRNQELCNLKVGNIEYDKINGGYTMRIIAKGNKHRIIPLVEKTMQSINLFRYARGLEKISQKTLPLLNPEEPVFTTNRGNAYSPSYLIQYIHRNMSNLSEDDTAAVEEMFSYMEHENPNDKHSPIIKKTMVISPHLFRHAFAIISSKVNNIDIYTISRSLGHANITTTQIYLEKVYEAERHVIHRWDKSALGEYI